MEVLRAPASLPSAEEMMQQWQQTEAELVQSVGYEHERRNTVEETIAPDVRFSMRRIMQPNRGPRRTRGGKRKRGRIHGKGARIHQIVNKSVRVRKH